MALEIASPLGPGNWDETMQLQLMSSDSPRDNQRSMQELPASFSALQSGAGHTHFTRG